jgi:diadenosine tetraphosphate (Ap4A) HIT family hydrolase
MARLDHAQYDAVARSGCFVCRILEGRPFVPNPRIVFEDDQVIAFLNQFPTQEGYTIVCPKRHVERYEADVSEEEWLYLQVIARKIAKAISEATGAIRMYVASLGSPERNAHLHLHLCPCPEGTPFEQQQFAAMEMKDGRYLDLSDERLDEIAAQIRQRLDDQG